MPVLLIDPVQARTDKKPYAAPLLQKYGDVRDVTLGASGTDDDSLGGFENTRRFGPAIPNGSSARRH
jgi:hypothetical protein